VGGGPGSGKTTIALRKAVARIRSGLRPGQSILFLSFSRAAITRIAEAAKSADAETQLRKDERSLLSMHTFHSFFWDLLRSHAYLLGAPRNLSILLPQDERALSGGIDDDDEAWPAWEAERTRLFREDGRIAFDLFLPNAVALLSRSRHLLRMVAQRHPIIVVDEAQDTGQHAWRCIELLAAHTQIVCLADLEQQIFDYLPGVGPERIAAIRQALHPLEIDFGTQNHRSSDTEIVTFGNDILAGTSRGAGYKGVSILPYALKGVAWNSTLRRALAFLFKIIRAKTSGPAQSVAILTPGNKSAIRLSTALNALGPDGGKPVRHKLMFDEAEALLCARFAAYLLEPKVPAHLSADLEQSLEMMATSKRATGKGKAKVKTLMDWAAKLRAGKTPKNGLVKGLQAVLEGLHAKPFSGDPRRDWSSLKKMLRDTGQDDLGQVARHLDYLVAFKRGARIGTNLASEWLRDGQYTNARQALDTALVQDQILDGAEDFDGIQVMTFHKAKGKQFDGVIIVREGRHSDDGMISNFVWWGDEEPYHRSRRILRVGITRAKVHTMILNPPWPSCPMLGQHKLDSAYEVVAQ
jgi:DNA helicase-2/ATP-dependent DNA helicase PcrA